MKIVFLTLAAASALFAQGPGGPQQPPAPTGPFAPEKFKNIQALTTVPADQLEMTMRYVSAAVNMPCLNCHVQESDGTFSYEKDDKRTKQTARGMMKMVVAMNAASYVVRVECATCHAGQNRPTGLPMAAMLTPEQVAAMNAPPPAPPQGFGGGPGGGSGGRGGFPGGPGGGSGGFGGGRGPAGPPAADVIAKYIDAVGGRPALEALKSMSLTGTVLNRAGQTLAFTIEEKGSKYRETRQTTPAATILGFDGTKGWRQATGSTMDLTPAALDLSLRLNDLAGAIHVSDKYATLTTGGRSMQINGQATTTVTGRSGMVTEQFIFEAASGLLVRRTINTRTPLGALQEQMDYSDYRQVGSVKIPFSIKRWTWDTLDTLTIKDAKANVNIDDAVFARPK